MLISETKLSGTFNDRGENGFILIVTMLILVVLTIVGMAALDSSTFEVRIAANDRLSKSSFNMADGSIFTAGKLITRAISEGVDPTGVSGVSFDGFNIIKDEEAGTTVAAPHDPQDFYKVVMGYVETKPARQEAATVEAPFNTADFTKPSVNPDAVYVPDIVISGFGSNSASVTIVGRSSQMIAGGGAEFGAGSAGAGVGSGGGGAAVTFDIDVSGSAGHNSRSSLSARYRNVLGGGG